jgi:hypothetical protein
MCQAATHVWFPLLPCTYIYSRFRYFLTWPRLCVAHGEAYIRDDVYPCVEGDDDDHNPAGDSRVDDTRGRARLAAQPELGLCSERYAEPTFGDLAAAGTQRPNLAQLRASVFRSHHSAESGSARASDGQSRASLVSSAIKRSAE